ncbi:hypothetical protein ABK040_012124 [Willaertia magna]
MQRLDNEIIELREELKRRNEEVYRLEGLMSKLQFFIKRFLSKDNENNMKLDDNKNKVLADLNSKIIEKNNNNIKETKSKHYDEGECLRNTQKGSMEGKVDNGKKFKKPQVTKNTKHNGSKNYHQKKTRLQKTVKISIERKNYKEFTTKIYCPEKNRNNNSLNNTKNNNKPPHRNSNQKSNKNNKNMSSSNNKRNRDQASIDVEKETNKENKKVNRNYSFGITIVTAETIVEGDEFHTLIVDNTPGSKITDIYIPQPKPNLIQILALNENDRKFIMNHLNKPEVKNKAKIQYYVSKLNFVSSAKDMMYQSNNLDDIKIQLRMILGEVYKTTNHGIQCINLSNNFKSGLFKLRIAYVPDELTNPLINAGFKQYKTLSTLASEFNNVCQITFTNSYTEQGIREIIRLIMNKAKINIIEQKLTIEQVDSSFDDSKYWKVIYTCQSNEETNRLINILHNCKGDLNPNSKIRTKKFKHLGAEFLVKANNLANKTSQIGHSFNFSNISHEQLEAKLSSMEKEIATVKEEINELAVRIGTVESGISTLINMFADQFSCNPNDYNDENMNNND